MESSSDMNSNNEELNHSSFYKADKSKRKSKNLLTVLKIAIKLGTVIVKFMLFCL